MASADGEHGKRLPVSEAFVFAPANADDTGSGDAPDAGRRVILRIEIPARTVLRILLVLAVLWVLSQIWMALFQVFLGIMIALALLPIVGRLERRGLSRSTAVVAVIGSAIGILALVLALVVPRAIADAQDFWDNLPTYVENGLSWLEGPQPDVYADAVAWAERQQQGGGGSGGFDVRGYLDTGVGVLSGLGNAVIVFVIAAYVLADRDYRFLRWAIRGLAEPTQRKIWRSIPAVTQVVSGYVLGQGLICLCFGVFSFIVLSVLGVPSALVLALVAFVADAIPMIGIIVATAPAVLLGFTQGPVTGAIVLATFLGYQQFENYLLSPRIFGRTLQISPLAILIAVLIGQQVFGILGVILALPIAASIPALERVWLGADEDGEAEEPAEAESDDGDLGHFPGRADAEEALDEGAPELARNRSEQPAPAGGAG